MNGFNTLMVPGSNSLMVGIDPELADIATLEANVATIATTADMQLYANGSTGNDANDGLTALTPKLTLSAVFALVPKLVRHNVTINLAGTFELGADAFGIGYYYEYLVMSHFIDDGKVICIDGGGNVTVVADDGGSSWVSDILTANTVGLTTAGWTINAYRGYFAEFTTGLATGQRRMIVGNTATTLTLVRDYDAGAAAPAVGDEFRIVRPATRLQVSSAATLGGFCGYMYQTARTFGGLVRWQRLSLGDGLQLGMEDGGTFTVSHLVSDGTGGLAPNHPVYVYSAGRVDIDGSLYDPTTWAYLSAATDSCAGLGAPAGAEPRITDVWGFGVFVYASALSALAVYNSVIADVSHGTKVWDGTNIFCCTFNDGYSRNYGGCFATTANYAPTSLTSSTGVGLTVERSKVRIEAGVDISGCASHGIQASETSLLLNGVVTGTGNTGAGLFVQRNSTVTFPTGSAPTLTGTVGDVAVVAPTVADTTWAAVDAGSALSIVSQQTLVTEV